MTDRELVVKAAKSIGMVVNDWVEMCPEGWYAVLGVPRADNVPPMLWNPLVSDGDAFRLAVKLGVDLQNMVLPTGNSRPTNSEGRGVAFPVNGSYERIVEWYTDEDAVAATRRAITRAAAAIQEARESK